MASAAKPLRRTSADQRLAEFLDRVRQVNRDPYWLYRVRKVVLFGSMLTESPTVNDVDLAVELSPKIEDRDELWHRKTERTEEAVHSGRRFRNISDQVGWPKKEIFMFLRARTRTLSVVDYAEEKEFFEKVSHRVIYEKP
jgi:predicted nucleotidyltransferase